MINENKTAEEKKLNKIVDELREQKVELQDKIKELEKTIFELRKTLDERDAEIEGYILDAQDRSQK